MPLDVDRYKGVSSQQILLSAVIKHIRNDSEPIENIDIDLPKLYQLVKSRCPTEWEQVKKLVLIEQG